MKASLRFSVLKRDRFTCVYCGKTPPDVLLEVDHVVPKSAGGQDIPENLLTACIDCNRGKGSRFLAEGEAPAVSPQVTAALKERLEQAKEYQLAQQEIREHRAELADEFYGAWCKAFGGKLSRGYFRCNTPFPAIGNALKWIDILGMAEVCDAIQVTAAKSYVRPRAAAPYFIGVCKGKLRDMNGGEA